MKLAAPPNSRGFKAALRPETAASYEKDWRHFERWCTAMGVSPFPASGALVAMFLATKVRAGVGAKRAGNLLCAINRRHFEHGLPIPGHEATTRLVNSGIKCTCKREVQKAPALTVSDLRALLAWLNGPLPERAVLRAQQMAAVLLVGLATGTRITTLLRIDMTPIRTIRDGFEIWVPWDKETGGRWTAVLHSLECGVTCPACALSRHRGNLVSAGFQEGPLFRTSDGGGSLNDRRLQRRRVTGQLGTLCRAVALKRRYTSRSLRRGFASESSRNGCDLNELREFMLHAASSTTFGYIERGRPRR